MVEITQAAVLVIGKELRLTSRTQNSHTSWQVLENAFRTHGKNLKALHQNRVQLSRKLKVQLCDRRNILM